MSDSQDSSGLSGRLTALFLSGEIGVAAVGYFVGINDGVPREYGSADRSWIEAELRSGGTNVPSGDQTADPQTPLLAGEIGDEASVMAVTYSEMRRSAKGPTSGWKPSIDQIPQPKYDLYEEFKPSEEEKQQSTLIRASRRAFNGAPPIIPHVIERTDDAACYACHGKGMRIDDRVANQMSHPFLANCTQCHAPAAPKPFADVDASVDSAFLGLPAPVKGDRAFPGAPPTMPHSTWKSEMSESEGLSRSPFSPQSSVPEHAMYEASWQHSQIEQLFADRSHRDVGRSEMTDSDCPVRLC